MTRLRLHAGVPPSQHDAELVFRLEGDLDVVGAPLLRQVLIRAAAEADTCVVVDLDGLTSMDAWGLDALVRAHEQARRTGRSVVLRSPPAAARRLFELAGLEISQ